MMCQLFQLMLASVVVVVCRAELTAPDGAQASCSTDKCDKSKTFTDVVKEEQNCWDQHRCCDTWAKKGQCKANTEWMNENCSTACGQCKRNKPYDGCKDYYEKCSTWAKDGECTANKQWMINNCRKACEACSLFQPARLEKDCKF